MKNLRRAIAFATAASAALLGLSCSGSLPADPSPSGDDRATATASPFSNTDSPQPSPQGAHLTGRILNESGEPVAGCLIRIDGDTREHAIVSGSDGEFDMGISLGSHTLILTCDPKLYAEARVAVEVPGTEEITQDFTVQTQ